MLSQRLTNGVDFFNVEDKIILLEELGNRGAMDLHLESADAQCTKRQSALTLFAVVGRLDAADAGRWNRIHIGDDLDTGNGRPNFFLYEFDPGGPTGQNNICPIDSACGCGFVSDFERRNI